MKKGKTNNAHGLTFGGGYGFIIRINLLIVGCFPSKRAW